MDSANYSSESGSTTDYSESSILSSNDEFGPETSPFKDSSKSKPNHNGLAHDKLPLIWVPSFRERVDKLVSRLLNDSMKFCTSGKINAPIIAIAIPKVTMEFIFSHISIHHQNINFQHKKRISFPLYEEMLDSIIPEFEQSPYGKGTETIVDTNFRNSLQLGHLDFEVGHY